MVEQLAGPSPAVASPAGLVLLSDRPVGEGGQRDLLDRAVEAAALAGLIRASRAAAPFTLAVFADWGMGKSSLLAQVSTELKAGGEDVVTVWFNAWTTRGGQGLEALVKAVLDRLDRRSLRRLARAVSGASQAASWLRVLARGVAQTFAMHHLVDEIWHKLEVDARTRNDAQRLLRAALQDWTGTDAASRPQRTIVVFVDDLDRCPPETIATVTSAMKQYLNVPGLVFVLACDQAVIEAAAHGTDDVGRETQAGRRFLEKVIQASYSIPAPTDIQVTRLVAGYAHEVGAIELFTGPVNAAVVQHVGRNPRRIKRLINRFVIEYHLDPEWQQLGAEALVRVALLQDFYPEFHWLLSTAGDFDPIEMFDDYLTLVRARKQTVEVDERDRARLVRALRAFGLDGVQEVTAETVSEVERDLPEQFPVLVRDKTFVSLVAHLVDHPAGEQLRAKLRRRSDARAAAPNAGGLGLHLVGTANSPDTAQAPSTGTSLSGLRVLWLSSKVAETGDVSLELGELGAIVFWAGSAAEAIALVQREPVDAVVTNLSRATGPDGGFDDIQALQSHGYTRALIIYTGYVSPARRARAAQLGAQITTWPNDVIAWLAAVTREPDPSPGSAARWEHDMQGLHLLWITPEIDLALQRNFESRGAAITVADGAATAAHSARTVRPHVLIVEGSKASDSVEAVRLAASYAVPTILWTSRVTPAKRDAARELGARVTDDAADLADTLMRMAVDLRRSFTDSSQPAGASSEDRSRYQQLARSADRLEKIGEIDMAEHQWSAAERLAHASGDAPAMLNALVRAAGIALRKRHYTRAIGRYDYALEHGALTTLATDQVRGIYQGLDSAYAALGDESRALHAREALAAYLSNPDDA